VILLLTDTPCEVVNGYTVPVVAGIRNCKSGIAVQKSRMNLHHINIKALAALLEAEIQFFCEVLGLPTARLNHAPVI
jgi:hypothetical protein